MSSGERGLFDSGEAMARPTKITGQLQAKIVELLQEGNTVEETCQQVGLSPATYYLWRVRGNEALSRNDDSESERPFVGFFTETSRALSQALATSIALKTLNKTESASTSRRVVSDSATLRDQGRQVANPQPLCVYLIRGSDGLVKIGKSANPEKRLKALNTGSSVELQLLGVVYDLFASDLETLFHRKFQHKRVRGEWFALSDSDVKSILGLGR